MQGSRTVEPFIASIVDTLPVETSSPPTLHTPEPREKGKGRVKKIEKHRKPLFLDLFGWTKEQKKKVKT